MKVVMLTLLVLLCGHAIALRISNNLPMNSGSPANKPSLSNLWPPPPNSNLQCQCTCEPSSNPGNHIYVSGDINIESSHAQTTYTPDATTTSFLTQIPVVLNNVEITHKRPVTDPPHHDQALAPMTTTSVPPKNGASEPGKTARTGAKPLSKGLQLRDRLKERRNRRIMLEQVSIRGNPAGVPRSVGTRIGVPIKDSFKAIPDTTTDHNSEMRTEVITTKSPMTANGNGTGSGSNDGQSNRNGKGSSNGSDITNGDQSVNTNRSGSGEGNRNRNTKVNGKTNGNGNVRPSAGNKNENKNGEQNPYDSNGKVGIKSNLKQSESRKQNNDNNNGNNSNNGSASYKHVDGSGINDKNDSVSAKDKMIIDLLQKLSSQTANNNNNPNNNNNNANNNNNNVGGRISDRWQGGQANTGWNKAPSTYPTTTASGFGFGIGFGMPPMMGMGMGDWIPNF